MNENESIHHRFTIENHKGKTPGYILPIWGWLMVGHFGFVAVRSFFNGTPEDIFWISHVGTLLGGIGTLLKNRSLVSIALVSIAGHHLFWLVDTIGWLLSGHFPFGTTTYLAQATALDWLQSSNHFFSLPILLWVVYRLGGVRPHSWLWSTALFAVLSCLSFLVLPQAANVNSAHQLWPGLDQTHLSILENWSWFFFWLALIIINGLCNYLPGNLILRGIYGLLFRRVKTK
jgi:hypothetical protein